MGSPWPTVLLCAGYVLLAKIIGPEIMASRKPLQLKKVILAYNAAQVVLSAYIVYESWAAMGWMKLWTGTLMCK